MTPYTTFLLVSTLKHFVFLYGLGLGIKFISCNSGTTRYNFFFSFDRKGYSGCVRDCVAVILALEFPVNEDVSP